MNIRYLPRILYKNIEIADEDKKIMVADKPQGMPAQPDESGDPDIISLLEERRGIEENKPGKGFVSAVNRLDRPTGGLMLFAKNSDTHAKLQNMLHNHEIKKTYFCVVIGEVKNKEGHLVSYIKTYPNGKRDLAPATETNVETAILDYKVLDVQEGLSLLEINLITGKKHQIRIQMAKVLKHPILGDFRYGQQMSNNKRIKLHLWAVKLCFIHPYDAYKKLVFISPPPVKEPAWNLFKIQEKYLAINVEHYMNGKNRLMYLQEYLDGSRPMEYIDETDE